MMRLFSLAVVLVLLGCDTEPEGDFAPNVAAPPEPLDDSEGRTKALGQAMDAAENIELEIGEYNDRIQRAVDRPTRPPGGAAKKIDARFGSRHNRRFLPSGQVAERLNAPDSKSGSRVSRDEGSNPLCPLLWVHSPFFVMRDP